MQVHFKNNDTGEIKAFQSAEDAERLINLHEFTKLNDDEVDRLYNPQKYLSEEEKLAYKRSQYPKLKRYQFMRGMLEYGYKASDIEAKIMQIKDEYTRELTLLGFKDAGYFDRNDQSIGVMRDVLGKTDLEIDEFFELCMTF